MRLRMTARPAVPTLLAAAALVLLAAGPALAADAHGGEKKGGLSFLALERYDLGIFTLITFGLLCLILFKFAWPKISEGLAKREASIVAARDESIKARQEAENLRGRLAAEFGQAQDKIRTLLDEARRDAEALRAREREAGLKDAAAELDRAKREIDAARDAALGEIYTKAVDLASLMSSKAIRRQLTLDDQSRLVEESLAELKAGAGRG